MGGSTAARGERPRAGTNRRFHRHPVSYWDAGERLIEVRYDRLAEHPREELARVREHFGLTEDPAWMDACCERLDTARRNPGTELHLPPRMAEAFNDWQARYDFEGRAGE